MKTQFVLFLFLLGILPVCSQTKNFYDFTVQDIQGQEYPLSQLKGRKVLVVNVASKCGLTPQYDMLQRLYEQYDRDGFVVVGFPANNFGAQEPGSNSDIQTFCMENYGVTFPMMAKISVKGDDIHPLYKWLTRKSENGVADAEVTWNFQKFMIDENGKWAGVLEPKSSPYDDRIINWLDGK